MEDYEYTLDVQSKCAKKYNKMLDDFYLLCIINLFKIKLGVRFMAMTLYFAKMNINSHIYRVYDDKSVMKMIFDKIYSEIKENVKFEKKFISIHDGFEYVQTDVFSFVKLDKMIGNSNDRIIYGKVLKQGHKYLKQGIGDNGELVSNKVPYLEENTFLFDVEKEVIAFHRSQNFGYKEFVEAFQGLLNACLNEVDTEAVFSFDVSLITKGIKIGEIKSELKKMGPLEELQITIIPPNPNSDILDEMDQHGQVLKEMKEGNINTYVVRLGSTDSKGVDLESKVVNTELNKATQIHKNLSEEEVTSRGYVKVQGRTREGKEFSSQDTKVISMRVTDDHREKDTFIKKCIEYVWNIFL